MSRRSIRLPGAFAMLVAVGFSRGFRSRDADAALGEAGGPAAAPATKYLVIPGLYSLNLESIRKEIGITEDQRAKLKDISDAYQANVQRFQADMRQNMADLQGLGPTAEETHRRDPAAGDAAWPVGPQEGRRRSHARADQGAGQHRFPALGGPRVGQPRPRSNSV